MQWAQISLVGIAIALLGACGSGGNGGGSNDDAVMERVLPLDELIGTYELEGFRVELNDGQVFTQSDFARVEGAMTIAPDGETQQRLL